MNLNVLGKVWKPALVVIGVVALLMWSSGAFKHKIQPGVVPTKVGLTIPEGTPTLQVTRRTLTEPVPVIGTAASETKITLSARIPAQVNRVLVSAGATVKADQELIILDDRELREQLAGAEAQAKQAEAELRRARELFAGQATTEQALNAAEAAAAAAKAQVERLKVMLSYARITSPIDGVVTDRRVETGDLAQPGQPLVAVYDPTRMRMEASVPVRLTALLKVGTPVETVLDRPERTLQGTVAEIVSEIDPASRTQLVKVRLPAAAGDVLPGAFGRLLIPAGEHPSIVVPASAVQRVGQLEMVQIVRDGRAVRRLVKTGARRSDGVEILSGLDEGETVLVKPLEGV